MTLSFSSIPFIPFKFKTLKLVIRTHNVDQKIVYRDDFKKSFTFFRDLLS